MSTILCINRNVRLFCTRGTKGNLMFWKWNIVFEISSENEIVRQRMSSVISVAALRSSMCEFLCGRLEGASSAYAFSRGPDHSAPSACPAPWRHP